MACTWAYRIGRSLVLSVMLLYTAFLIWLMGTDLTQAHSSMKYLSSDLGQDVPDRDYASDCRLLIPGTGWNLPVIGAAVLDVFAVAHVVGWWAKALVIRNWLLLMTWSTMFEFMELTFKHMLPNFNECWWDSWLLDVAICNPLGIVLGMATMKGLGWKHQRYDWQGVDQQPPASHADQCTPKPLGLLAWARVNSLRFVSPCWLLQAAVPVALGVIGETNGFFLKSALWVPPSSPLNAYRLLIQLVGSLIGTWEYYAGYLQAHTSPSGGARQAMRKPGVFVVLVFLLCFLETSVNIKFGRGLYPAPWPPAVLWSWTVAATVVLVALCAWQWRRISASTMSVGGQPYRVGLTQQQAPAYVRHPFILNGYRTGGTYIRCLWALFEWHCKTLNAWTMILGGLLSAALLLGSWAHLQPTLVNGLPFITLTTSVWLHMPFSVCFHLFRGMGPRIYNRWRKLDQVLLFQYNMLLTYGLSYYVYSWRGTAMNTLLSTVVAQVATAHLCSLPPWYQRKRHNMYLFVGSILLCSALPMIYQAVTDLQAGQGPTLAVWLTAATFMAIQLGGIVYAHAFPQRYFPGVFDLVGCSHQLMHVCGFIAHSLQFMFVVNMYKRHHLPVPSMACA